MPDDQIREELLDDIIARVQADEVPDHTVQSALRTAGERLQTQQSKGSSSDPCSRRRIWVGASLTRRRILPLGIAAAAAVVLLAVGLWPESTHKGGSGRVYALSDIPQLLRSARVLHLHGWASGDRRVKLVRDYWLDTANGRWHISHRITGLVDQADPPEELRKLKHRDRQWVFDGEYQMTLADEAPGAPEDQTTRTTAEFFRLTPFRRNLELRRNYGWATEFLEDFEDVMALGLFVKAGRETIDGVAFDIWESQHDMGRLDKTADKVVFDGRYLIRIKVWWSPELGVLGRVEKWVSNPETQGAWVLGEVAEKIERDVAPPPGIFDTVPPAGCTLRNTKETARLDTLDTGGSSEDIGNLGLRCYAGFNLGDGTILLGWRSEVRGSTESQAPLFQDLIPGGPLPKLPIVIHTLVPQNPACQITYTGRHLAWTQKGDRFYEWGLFVPDKDLTLPKDRCAGNLDIRYTLDPATSGEQKTLHYGGDWVGADTRIKDPADFQELVLEAMAELSDSGTAPEGMTYEYVTQLSRHIRESLGKP